MAKNQKEGLIIGMSILLLLGLFIAATQFMNEEVEIKTTGLETAQVEFIPRMTTTEAGFIKMNFKYIPVSRNINVFDFIFEREEILICDSEHTAFFKLSLESEDDKLRVYNIEKILEGTVFRILSMNINTLNYFITPDTELFQSQNGEYVGEVKTDAGKVFLNLTVKDIVEGAEE